MLDDAAGIARVHIQAWRESYAHLLPAAVPRRTGAGPAGGKVARIIAAATSDIWVACQGRTSSAGRAPGPDATTTAPGPGSWRASMCSPATTARGRGSCCWTQPWATRGAYLWIAEENPRAFAFYRRNGFVPDGATAVRMSWPEHRSGSCGWCAEPSAVRCAGPNGRSVSPWRSARLRSRPNSPGRRRSGPGPRRAGTFPGKVPASHARRRPRPGRRPAAWSRR